MIERTGRQWKLYIGTGATQTPGPQGPSRGIYAATLDGQTGELALSGLAAELDNPTFLALNPDGTRLYSVSEVGNHRGTHTGAAYAFAIDPASGGLRRLGDRSSGGPGPAYISTDRSGRLVMVANYAAGSIAALRVDTDGSLSDGPQIIQHEGTGPVIDRQDAPHAHCILSDRANRFALAVDLGADAIMVYALAPARGRLSPAPTPKIPARPGSGPRHLAFHPTLDLFYVSGELDSTVSVYRYEPETGAAVEAQALSTLPAGFTGTNYPSEIAVAPSGQYVYLANRGHNSIAVFAVGAQGLLTPAGHQSTEGDWPRHFSLDPAGDWLVIANQNGNNIVVLAVDRATGTLAATGHRVELSSPMCIRFAK
jgi:6-phosphogluconolactonase